MKIKVEPFLMRKGIKVASGAIEFDDPNTPLTGFHLVGFTICDDKEKGLFVLFPANASKDINTNKTKQWFFLRPGDDQALDRLEKAILDVYEQMTGDYISGD